MSNVEKIRAAISNLDDSVAKDTLALLLAEKEVQGTKKGKDTVNQIPNDKTAFDNFAQAINFLKAKYKFQELSLFSTEADLVYVNTEDRKVLLTDTSVKPKENTRPTEQQDFENAFEPLNKNGRFSNLEL